jgi:hypothetical protein
MNSFCPSDPGNTNNKTVFLFTHSSRKGLTVQKTIPELHSYPLSDVSNPEVSNTEMVNSNYQPQVCGEVHSLI